MDDGVPIPGGHDDGMGPVEAAVMLARRFGVAVADPVTLSDSNNVVVWLWPAPVVAKVGTGHHRRLGVELAVAGHLAASGAPVVAPASQVPQVVHRAGGFHVTCWDYHPGPGREPAAGERAAALARVHEGLGGYRGRLPSWRAELAAVADVLGDPARAPALPPGDRALLLCALERFAAELARYPAAARPLHGSPHTGNIVVTGAGIRFLDFETACTGPLEWDLAHAGPETALAYPGRLDPALLGLCRGLVSVKTAAWCWAGFGHPALRWHAEHHLAVVKTLMARQ
jgi:Phosphotransferase enzyme family